MKLHWPVPSTVHSTASHRANHPTVMKPFRAGLALLATGSLIFGGNLPAALAQAPHEDSTQTDQAEAATPASPFSVPTNAGSPRALREVLLPVPFPSRSLISSSSPTPTMQSSEPRSVAEMPRWPEE